MRQTIYVKLHSKKAVTNGLKTAIVLQPRMHMGAEIDLFGLSAPFFVNIIEIV